MIFASLFAIVALALLCALIFAMTINALPLYAGIAVGLFTYSLGLGITASILIGLLVGIVTLTAAHLALAASTSTPVHAVIGLMFAAPAAFVGYHLVHGIMLLTTASTFASALMATFGALVAGLAAWARIGPRGAPHPAR